MGDRNKPPEARLGRKRPDLVQHFEASLYCSAPSLEAYSDATTLQTRLNQLANDIRKSHRQVEDEKVKAGDPREEINNKDSIVPKEVTPQNNKESQDQQRQQQQQQQKNVEGLRSMDEGE